LVAHDYSAVMAPNSAALFRIVHAPPQRWPLIRRFVDSQLPDDARRLQWRSVLDGIISGELPAGGLIEARSATPTESLFGVIWIQPQDGRVASLLAPIVLDLVLGQPHAQRIAIELLEAAVRVAAVGGARLVQALLEIDARNVADQLLQAGFRQIAKLHYLVSSPESFPTAPPASDLEFEPWTAAANERLESIVEQSYIGTRDCPQLNGVRLTAEVLAGYRSIGSFDPARWLLIRHAGHDVGCLLLTEYPQKIWELAYMGLTPEARGHGWGLQLTRHGQWLARQAGASRFVLAVDASNEPALSAYAAAGLVCWDRRGAWLRILDPANRQ
jgi:ribosomal protein S18 acetylase RimI-like enzyme